MLAIFLAAIMLWVTEAIPLSATAVLEIMAELLLVSDQALLPVAETAPASSTFFAALANPVIILFLGGFMLADGASKYGVDRAIAAVMLKPFLSSPRMMLMVHANGWTFNVHVEYGHDRDNVCSVHARVVTASEG